MSEFAIVTVIHNSEPELPGLLDSVARLPEPTPRVIVVDSGSGDGGPALAAEHGAEVIRLDGNRGFGAGCNAGIERVTEPVTALVNPDVELLDDGLVRLTRDAAAGGALLAPRLLNADGSVQDSAHPAPGRVEALIPALLPRRILPVGATSRGGAAGRARWGGRWPPASSGAPTSCARWARSTRARSSSTRTWSCA